jgi:hypothetical protein
MITSTAYTELLLVLSTLKNTKLPFIEVIYCLTPPIVGIDIERVDAAGLYSQLDVIVLI